MSSGLQNVQPPLDILAPTLGSKKAKEGRIKVMSAQNEARFCLILHKKVIVRITHLPLFPPGKWCLSWSRTLQRVEVLSGTTQESLMKSVRKEMLLRKESKLQSCGGIRWKLHEITAPH